MGAAKGSKRDTPTLMSLARELGVSHQTVSNVLNNPELVKPETRERVLKGIRESGYRPSAVGRALRTSRSMSIALRLRPSGDGVNREVMDRFVHHLAEGAQAKGYRIQLITAPDDADEVRLLQELFRDGSIDGTILTDTHFDDLRPQVLAFEGLPTVSFGRPWGASQPTVPWVDVDGAAGTYQATRYLLEAGHDTVGFISWPTPSGVGEDRRSGWMRGVADLTEDPAKWMVTCQDSVREGAAAAAELRSRGVTALVCASDSLALGAASVFRVDHEGGPLPIVGFDDSPVARSLGLSSISQPVEDAAAQAISILLKLLRGDHDGPLEQLLLPPSLRIRDLELFAL